MWLRTSNLVSVKGVEINPTLCNICEQNLLKTKAKKTKLFKMDAAEFNEYQSQEIVYCFNSFGLKTIEKVEKKLRRNKDVYFIYCNPVHSSIFDGWNLVWTDNNKMLLGILKYSIFPTDSPKTCDGFSVELYFILTASPPKVMCNVLAWYAYRLNKKL